MFFVNPRKQTTTKMLHKVNFITLIMTLRAMMRDFTKSCIIRSVPSILHGRSNNCIAVLHNALTAYFTQTSHLLKCNLTLMHCNSATVTVPTQYNTMYQSTDCRIHSNRFSRLRALIFIWTSLQRELPNIWRWSPVVCTLICI